MEFLSAYLLFIAKAATFVVISIIFFAILIALISKGKRKNNVIDEDLEVTYLNSEIQADKLALESEILDKKDKKQLKKSPVKPEKDSSRLFVIDFDGDIHASDTEFLRRQITAIIQTANKDKDSVLLRLESPGGVVHGYGLAASQLIRLKSAGIYLTVAVDKVAASGGYMMACVADKIISAPFAVLGSIGVIAQVPNIHRLLKEKNVDIELHTAGKYKRTLTMLGENTDEARDKFKEELNLTHDLFKSHITANRPSISIEEVSTGETWYGQQALSNDLVDEIMTSDDFLLNAIKDKDVYLIGIERKEGLIDKLKGQFMTAKKANFKQDYFM